ncbi:MAG: hypothetical protein ABW019_00695 [Chitinophagaceae bacterium]
MMGVRAFLLCVALAAGLGAEAQKIIYSEPERDDTRRLNFEIIGRISGNFLIYKNIRSKHWISVLNNDMVQVAKVDQDYLPENDNVINVDFFPYSDFCYMIYQYRKRNIIHCVAARIDGNGNKIGDLMLLDTTQVSFGSDSKIYSVLTSDDKSKIMVFKINSRNKRLYIITSILLDDRFNELKKSRLMMPMNDRDDYLTEFQLDNDGDLVFAKFDRVNNENIGSAAFVIKYAQADTFLVRPLTLEKTYLDEIRIKPDNYNKRYFITSFYYKQRRGNVDGYYFYIWDKNQARPIIEDTITFSEELRREARGNANNKGAFNDYFIRNIITRKDGGFILGSEAYYTVARGNSWNRWNYLYGSPYLRSYDYYYYSPYYNSYWWNRWTDGQAVRYHADNIVVLSFDSTGRKEWSVVITKEQYNDESDDEISYQVMNTGGELHFLFNESERKVQLLNDFSVDPTGKAKRNPTLKNLDKGYIFMPKFGKQVSARQMIIPCLVRNYISFAKIEYNN